MTRRPPGHPEQGEEYPMSKWMRLVALFGAFSLMAVAAGCGIAPGIFEVRSGFWPRPRYA